MFIRHRRSRNCTVHRNTSSTRLCTPQNKTNKKTQKTRMSYIKKLIGERAYTEKAKGSDEENKHYCSKDGKVLHQIGSIDAIQTANKQHLQSSYLHRQPNRRTYGAELGDLINEERYAKAFANIKTTSNHLSPSKKDPAPNNNSCSTTRTSHSDHGNKNSMTT